MSATTATTTTPGRTRRATPMAPAERRAAIVAATIPLLRAHGVGVTTRQIADAAGVAEGTIFSVFPDKDSLVTAAIEAALDPDQAIARIAAIDPGGQLEQRVRAAVSIVQDHVASTWQLLSAVGQPGAAPRRSPDASLEASTRLAAAIATTLGPDDEQLRHARSDAARALLALTVGCSHPAIVEAPMPPDQIVELLLRGVHRGDR